MSYYPKLKTYTLSLGDKELVVEIGKLAQQANGSVVITMGGTTLLATATMSVNERDIGFFPLMVNYQEKMYAAGLIKSSRFMKREGRPADDKILMGRVIDRTIRPLFPKGLKKDVQVMLTTLSYDGENEHDMVAAVGASIALSISDIPWNGPCASVRVGMINGEFVLNPSREARSTSDLDLIVSSSAQNIIMIEAGANEIPEEKMLEALAFGKKWGQKICGFISDIQSKIGKTKMEFSVPEEDEELKKWLEGEVSEKMRDCIFTIPEKKERFRTKAQIIEDAQKKAEEHFGEERDLSQFKALADTIFKTIVRNSILKDEKRIAGRKLTEIRPLNCEVGILERTHGSGLFNRGETQNLAVATLAAPGNELIVDGIEGESKRRFMHHYNFPPFSVGECSNRLFTGNREIGHGALAQRALEPVLPAQADFPYIIRVVSEILESNGSSSMAATCGCTLALMDAGVPISAPVGGIAMGLMTDPDTGEYKVLTDLQDEEDFGGDMDFKVTGTEKGITAIQMDIKLLGIADEIFKDAFAQAHQGRLEILKAMTDAISEPRKELSPYAPRLETIKVETEDIRLVIGKGGETIQKITGDTGVEMNIEDDGTITIASNDGDAMAKAKAMVMAIVAKPEVGKTYEAKIVRIEAYGAFAEYMPNKQGLIHVSLIANERVEDVSKYVKMGQIVKVKLTEIDREGRVRLSMKDAVQE